MSDDLLGGPIDETSWATQLAAHVVDERAAPRVYGYSVDRDLVPHYSFVELLLLASTGELPTSAVARVVDAALVSLAAFGAAEGPSRAAQLALLSSAQESAALVTATVALVERARVELDALAPFLAWLEGGAEGAPPACARAGADDTADGPAHRASFDAAALLELCRASGLDDHLVAGLGRLASAVMILWRAGIRSPGTLAHLITNARLPVVLAEARHALPLGFAGHPANTPRLEFVGHEDPP